MPQKKRGLSFVYKHYELVISSEWAYCLLGACDTDLWTESSEATLQILIRGMTAQRGCDGEATKAGNAEKEESSGFDKQISLVIKNMSLGWV